MTDEYIERICCECGEGFEGTEEDDYCPDCYDLVSNYGENTK